MHAPAYVHSHSHTLFLVAKRLPRKRNASLSPLDPIFFTVLLCQNRHTYAQADSADKSNHLGRLRSPILEQAIGLLRERVIDLHNKENTQQANVICCRYSSMCTNNRRLLFQQTIASSCLMLIWPLLLLPG